MLRTTPGPRSVQGKAERQACSLPRECLRSRYRYVEARRQDRYTDRVVCSGFQNTCRGEEIKAGNIRSGCAHRVSIGVQDTERSRRHAHASGSRHVARNRIGDFARSQAVVLLEDVQSLMYRPGVGRNNFVGAVKGGRREVERSAAYGRRRSAHAKVCGY